MTNTFVKVTASFVIIFLLFTCKRSEPVIENTSLTTTELSEIIYSVGGDLNEFIRKDTFSQYLILDDLLNVSRYPLLLKHNSAVWLHFKDTSVIYDLVDSTKAIFTDSTNPNAISYQKRTKYYWPLIDKSFRNRFYRNKNKLDYIANIDYNTIRYCETDDSDFGIIISCYSMHYNLETKFIDSIDIRLLSDDVVVSYFAWSLLRKDTLSELNVEIFSSVYLDSILKINRFSNKYHVDKSINGLIENYNVLIDSDYNRIFMRYFKKFENSDIVIIFFWYKGCFPCHLTKKVLDTLNTKIEMDVIGINPIDSLSTGIGDMYDYIHPIEKYRTEIATDYLVESYPAIFIYKNSKFICKFDYYSSKLSSEIESCIYYK